MCVCVGIDAFVKLLEIGCQRVSPFSRVPFLVEVLRYSRPGRDFGVLCGAPAVSSPQPRILFSLLAVFSAEVLEMSRFMVGSVDFLIPSLSLRFLWFSLVCRASDPGQSQRAQRSKKFDISSEIENFERERNFRASRPPRPYFCGGIETSRLKCSSGIKNFDRDQKFRSRSNFFDRWALWDVERLAGSS